MADKHNPVFTPEVARPVHIQRLEKSLELAPFLSCFEQTVNNSVNDEDYSSTEDCDQTFNSYDEDHITNTDGNNLQ